MNNEEIIEAAMKDLLFRAQIMEPTQYDLHLAAEAIKYANINLYNGKTYTHKDWANHRRFEIKSLCYFMRKKYFENKDAVSYFHTKEIMELGGLSDVVSHPLFGSDDN